MRDEFNLKYSSLVEKFSENGSIQDQKAFVKEKVKRDEKKEKKERKRKKQERKRENEFRNGID